MVFCSVIFLFLFLPVTFIIYYCIHPKLRNYWLLLMSIVFYAWGEPKYVFLILGSTVVNYLLGLIMDRQELDMRRKLALATTIFFNIGILVFFKYSVFFAEIIKAVTDVDLSSTFLVSKSAMPIGISFFTFQIISYQIDLYRKNIPVQKDPSKITLYIMLFPQMIAGPIVRYIDIAKEIDNRQLDRDTIFSGVMLFMRGFAKKIIVSNTMAVAADYAYGNVGLSGALAWLGAVTYMLQIYFDFSGYSDMAIGMGKMAGFHFSENFNFPYSASSIQDFWRRWHISLSSWFRDYLYIPLGGNRKGKARMYINQLIVFFTTGLWHGASFNFIFWGLYHGFFLCIEKLGLREKMEKLPNIFSKIYTLLIVLIGWVFFRADTMSDAVKTVATMFNPFVWNWTAVLPVINSEMIFILIIGAVLSLDLFRKFRTEHTIAYSRIETAVLPAVFVIAVLYCIGTDFNPFIYFRF